MLKSPPVRPAAARTPARPQPAPVRRRHSEAAAPQAFTELPGPRAGRPPSFAHPDAARGPPVELLILVLRVLQAVFCGSVKKPRRLACPLKTTVKRAALFSF
ncbi:Multidrug And Toxin Extrusion Protein 1 [Manis pentadactyla]|nr:Multidrug And Toxin Extrusion Protein 1 [Manis pentadactyla]